MLYWPVPIDWAGLGALSCYTLYDPCIAIRPPISKWVFASILNAVQSIPASN